LELLRLVGGAWLYARKAVCASLGRRYLFWSFVTLLAIAQGLTNFGPPPGSPHAMAVSALVSYAVLALLAACVERLTAPATHSTS